MENKADILKLIQSWDQMIKQGRISEVRKELSKQPNRCPEAVRLPLAHLCRRVGLNSKALKILSQNLLKPVPENLPKAWVPEYAVNLQRLGSVTEAIRLLEQQQGWEHQMSLAYCHISQWNYLQAKLSIEKYLAGSPEPYQALVAQVNLAASLVSLEIWDEALELLTEVVQELVQQQAHRLTANCYELMTQAHIGKQQYDLAEKKLLKGLDILEGQGSIDSFFLDKWKSVIEAFRTSEVVPLLEIRSQAEQRGHFETVRDMDFQSLRIDYDEALRDHLYFGSRSVHYKNRIERHFGLPQTDYVQNPSGDHTLKVEAGEVQGELIFKPGSKPHAMLCSLFSDFYRAKKLGEVFDDIYPEEYFDIFTSPDRLHQVLKRLRQGMQKHNLQLGIESSDAGYTIQAPESLRIVFSKPVVVRDRFRVRVEKLIDAFTGKDFSAREAAKILEISHSNANRVLKKAVEENQLEKISNGPHTYYKVS